MKKTFFTLILLAAVSFLSAQSLQFEWEDKVYANNEIVICDASPNDWGEIIMDMGLRNLTNDTISVIVEKEHFKIVENTQNSFCWGLCFGPDTFVSRPAKDLAGNTLSGPGDLSFHYQVDPTYSGDSTSFLSGTTIVRYYAYPERNPEDKVCLEVWFAYNANSVNEGVLNLSVAYPNPATNVVHFDYSSNNGSVMNAVVYNLLGQEVKSQTVSGGYGRIDIAVDDLQPGIYFCSIMVDNTAVKTEKFIVKR